MQKEHTQTRKLYRKKKKTDCRSDGFKCNLTKEEKKERNNLP